MLHLDVEKSILRFSSGQKLEETCVDFTEQARQTNREICGLVAGEVNATSVVISTICRVPNTHRSRNSFGISYKDVKDFCAANGSRFLGVIHTHQKSCSPSHSDLIAMKRLSWLFLILSPSPDISDLFQIAGYQWDKEILKHYVMKRMK